MPSKLSLKTASRKNKNSERRRAPLSDLPSVAIVYALTAAGVYIYASSFLRTAPELPGQEAVLPLVFLGILPFSLFVLFVLRIREIIIELRRGRYGSRLRLRYVGLFLAVILAAAVPEGLVLTQLARTAVSNTASKAIRDGLSGSLDLVTSYYQDDAERLESLSRNVLPDIAEKYLPKSPARALETLKRSEPRLDALEIWKSGSRAAFAGDIGAQLQTPPAPASSGPLPIATLGGTTWLRYLQPWKDSALILSLRMPPKFDANVGILSDANRQAKLMEPFSQYWSKLVIIIYIYLLLPLLFTAALIGLAAADSMVEPLASLEKAARSVSLGDFSVRILVKPGDESGRLISSFNRMLDELGRSREGELRQGKIDAWQDIAQRLAHELKNPLTPIRLSAERVLRLSKTDPARAQEILEPSMLAIVSEVEGMTALLTDFRSFAALPAPEREWAELRSIVEKAIAPYAASYPDIAFSIEGVTPGLSLRVDRSQLERAFSNLIANAIDAMQGRGRVEISSDLVKASDSRYCRIRVRDSGPGIPRELTEKIFAPYFTTKNSGTGLGLSIVERIVQDHGGSIRCESEPGMGATFLIDLPLDR